jgi:hypothetical protein
MPSQPSNNPYKSPGPALSESRGFTGVELYLPPQDQSGNMLLQADNVYNIAGQLYVRPGMLGLFGGSAPSSGSSSSHGSSGSSSSSSAYIDIGSTYYAVPSSALYPLCDFTDEGGNTWMLITFGGRLFKTLQASGSYTELLDTNRMPYALNSPVVDCVRVGDYAYLVDGAHPLIRVSLSGGFPAYAMQPPTDAPTVSLSDVTIDSPTASQWSPGPIPGNQTSQLIANGYFDVTGAVSGNVYLPGAPWTVGGGVYVLPTTSPDYGPFSYTNGHSQQHIEGHNFSLLLDDPADGVQQPFYAPYNVATAWPNTNNLLRSACFLFGCQLYPQNPGSSASLAVTLTAYIGGQPYSSQTQVLYPSNTASWAQLTAAFNFTQSLPSDPDYYMLSLSSGPKNVGGNGVWVAGCTLLPTWDGPVLTDTGNGQVKWTANYGCIGGSYMVRSYVVPKDFSNVGTLGFAISSTSVPLTDLYIRFGFVAFPSSSSSSSSAHSSSSSSSGYPFDGAGTIEWSNDISFNDAGTFGYCDITTIDPAVLANVQHLFIQTVLDLPLGDITPGTPTNILTFGPLTAAGELSVGYQYVYYVTESAQIDAENIVESNPSAPSATITTTIEQAEANITLPADCYVNAATNLVTLWRLGGVWDDVRQIAVVPTDADVAYGSDPNNPYYSWNHTTRTFLDNTPDVFLALANLISFGRYPQPSNAQAVAQWQGRLWLAVGNTVYASWLYNADNSDPLYTTLVQTENDPNLPIEGASFPISPDPSDTIVRMIPYGTPIVAGNQFGGGLVVLCKRSVWLIQGQDASSFTLQQYPYTEGVGLVAFRGVTRIDSNLMAFMGPDRLHLFPPTEDSPEKDRGLPIQPQLYPVPPQTLQNQSAFALSWMLFHDQKILLGCPVPGGGQNSVIWIYDLRVGGWLRWTGPQGASSSSSSSSSSASSGSSSSSSTPSGPTFPLQGMAITGAMSLPPTSNGAQYDLYLFGLDGQLYRMTGTVDQYTPLSLSQAIPFVITVHAMRPAFFVRYRARALYYMWARLERFEVEMVMNGTLTMTAQAYMTGLANPTPIPSARSVQTYGLVGGGRAFRMDVPSGLIEGQYIELTLSGSVTDVAYLRGVRGWISGTSYEQGP